MVCRSLNSDGLPRYHLRRIGRRPSLPDVTNYIDFDKRVTLIGRNSEVVDYVLSSTHESQKRCISRTHARVIRSPLGNQHRLVDSSFTGVYVNDRRLDGDVVLSEGDTVTFGHPQSCRVDQGERVRQPNSEFYFMFELCDCEQERGTVPSHESTPCTTPTVLEFQQHQLSLDGWEVPAAPSGQGSSAGREARTDCHSTPVALSSQERSRNGAKVSTVAAVFLPVDGVSLRGEVRTSASPSPSSVSAGSSMGGAWDEIREPALEMDWVPPADEAKDAGAERVTEATVDRIATGNFNQHQRKGVQIQFTEQDSTLRQEAPATQSAESSMPPICDACGDSALSDWQGLLHQEDCCPHPSREGDLVTGVISGAPHRDWEETAVTDSLAPTVKSEGRHNAVSNPSEGTLVEGNSAPEHSFSAQSLEVFEDPDNRLRGACQSRGVPGGNFLPEGGIAEGTARRRENERLSGYPQEALVDPAHEDDALPQPMDVRSTPLEQLTEAGTTAGVIAGGNGSACEREKQLSSDNSHQSAIVLNCPEATLGAETSDSLPGGVSSTPAERVEKDVSLINSEMLRGPGILMESQGPHKLEAVSVRQSGWVKQRREGSSFVKEMGTATDTARAKCTTLDSSVPKPSSTSFASETKLESKLPVELAENNDSVPVATLSTFGPSDPGENERPVIPSWKLHSSPVGPQGGVQDQVSTAIDPTEGEHGYRAHGEEARALGESETHRKPPRPSTDVDVEDMQAQGELNLLDQRAQEMDTEESKEMEMEADSSCGVEAGTLREAAESQELEVGASWGMETETSQEMETRVSLGIEMGASREPEIVESQEMEVEIPHQAVISAPREIDTDASRELETERSQQMETGASLEMEMGEVLKSDSNLEGTIHLNAPPELEVATHGRVEGGGSVADVDVKHCGPNGEEDDSDAKEASELIRLSLKVDAEETGETMDKSMEVDLVSECADRDVDVANVTPAAVARKVPLPRGGAVASATRLDYEVISKPISPEPSASAGELVAIQEKMFLPERVETHSKTELINPCVQPIHRAPEGEDHLQFPVKTQELGNLFCRPEALGTPSAEVGRSAETSPFSVPEAGEGVRKPNGVLAHHQTPTPPDPILSEEGSESQTLLSLIIPEKGSETPTPPDPTLSEGSETPTPLDPTLSEEGSETPTSPDPTLSEEGSETPTPPDPALSEEGSETPTPPDPTLSEEGSETPTPPDPTLSEEGFETQTLLDPTFSERGSEIPTSPDPTLSEEGFETPTSLSPTASEKESEIPTPPDPILSEEGSETPTPPDPTLSEEGFETQTLLDPTLSEEGSETPTSLSSTTSEKESETPKSLSPTVPEGEPETPMSLGSTTSEGGPEAPTSPDPTAPEKEADLPKLQDSSVSEQGSNPLIDCERGTGPFAPGRPTISSTATVQGPTVAEGGAGIPTLGEPIVPEGVNNITRSELEINSFTSQGLTITEGESDITAPQGPSVTVRESDISAPQGPSVTERESDISVPYDLSVTERELDISDPRGPSVTREPDVTASQGPSVTKVGSDITAPQGPSVTEVGSNISAPLGLSVTESDISAPQGPGVTERGSGIFSPYGPSVTRELDITAPQGPSVTERELDISAPQGPGVTEGEIRVPTSPAANMEEHFGRKAIVLSGYKGGSDPQLNQTLPGSETLPCDGFPVAEKTTVEQKVVADDPHWPSGIIPDEWLLSWDARLHLSTPPAGGLVLSEPEKHESASSKVGTSLAAGLTDQPGQCVAGAGEGKQVGTNECQGSGASPFPSGVMGVVGGSPADPGDLQRTESQEDAKEEGGRPGELEPGLSDTVIGHLECHVVDQLEAPSTTEVGGEDAFSGIEHVEDEQSGKDHVFGGSEHGSVQSSVLSSSDLAAPGCVLKTELGQVCPNDPHTREERRFQPSVTHFASAQSSVWDTKEERSTCKASTATGVKLIPGGSDNRELVDERYGEANGPRASGPSPSQVQQVWSSGRQKEPPHTPPDPDGQLQAYTEAMPASTSGKPQAEVKKGVDAAEGTLGEKGLCVLEDGIGAVKTPSRYSDLAHDTRDRTQSLQLQLTPEKPEEDTSKKCRPPVREGGRMDTCEARQAGKRTDLAGEGKESLFPEASCRAKSMAASLDGVESETINVAHQDWGKNWVEIASRIGVDLDPGDDSSHVKLNPECPNPQHSEIKLEEEDLAGNWRSNGSRHIGSVALKRPCESELADSSSSFAPSKRKCTDQQKGPGELHSERRINLSLLSFSNQLKQNRANYIGRMVRQFFAEYRPPWEHRVPKLAVVNRQGEVARIVKDFFKSLSVPCKAEVVDGPQHSMTSSGSSQRHSHSGLESGEDQMEVSENQERQLERLCEIGPPGPALMHVTNDTKATVSHHASGGISWHDRDAGDMETCLPPEDSDVTRESEAAQESSWDATPDLLNHSPHLGQNACGITQLEENSPVEDLETPFCSTQGRKVYTEAPSPPQVGPIALPWFPSITESPKVPGHSSNVSGTEEMVCDGRDSLLLKAPHTPLKPSSCNLVDNVEESWTDQSPFRPAERTADLARDDRSSSGMSACLPALGRDSCPPNLTDPGQVMERGDPFQSREGMNSLGVVQSSSPGCCRLAQCDSVDGHYAAQLGCSNNETESDSTGEPPAPDDTHLGCSDDEIESVNLAESSALGDNFHDRTNNKLECVDVVEPALHHRSLQESDSDISHSVAQPGSNALGFSDKETESVNAKGQPADSDTALGLNEDESELGNSVEPSALDSSDLGCSDSVHQPDRVTELSGLSNNVLALSNDKIVGPSAHDDSDDEVEPVNIAETPALDSNDLSCCDSVVELVGITGSPGLDNNILGGSNDETQSVITVELPALDSSNPGRNDNLVGSVDVTEPPALDNDLDHSDDETELVISDEPQALDDNDLGHSDETELVISAEPQAPDNDLDHSDDETELVISDEPQALDDNDLGHSDDETELVISAEPQALNDSDLGRSDNVIKPVNVAESSGLNDDALGLSNDEAELGNIAEPPALDDSNLGQGENEAEPVVTTKPPACDSNAPGHRDDQIEPVNVEQLFPHCNNLSYSNMKMESDDVTERSSLDVGHNACSVDVSALGQSSPGSLAGVGSAAALGRSTERQGLSDGLSDAGGCIVRGVAPGDHAVPGQSHRKGWELPDSHSPDQGGTMGCRSSREHESGVEQSPSWLTSQPAGLQLKNPLGTTAWSTIMEDPAWSETLAQLRWGGGLRVGRTSSEKAAHLETPGEPVACRECDTGFVPPSLVHCWAKSDEDISFQLKECSLLLRDISEALEAEGVAEQHVSEWREQIKELQEQTVPPRTYVAVVGDTGSGKSSLLNALLDEEGVLPTSAMRACTAVVVEVSHNASSRCYRADIEFFSEEEWNKELLALLSDMTDKKGRLKKRRPDPGSEASVAYSRVKAVYGRVLPYTELAQIRGVTQYLGTTKTISEVQVNDFCSKVQPYIDSRNDSSNSRGGEFWPIVKRVRVQVPNSPVLQTGAVLVDLPGVRDSNAARNSVAKEYLKTCNAVWIVANVTRAVDDKTAKETLDESLRRQLLMDGQFGCIAFICTKTDSHNVTEIMRALSMTDACSSLEAEIAELRDRIDQQQANQKAWRLELECAQSSSENGKRAKQLELAIKQLEVDLTHLRHEEGVKQRELSLNAIRARNYFCKQKICLNFKRGLQDLKCQVIDEDTDSDEDQEESDETEEEEEEDVCEVYPSMADGPGPDPPMDTQLPVFTVSSTEYLKLRDKLQRDGPPRVFHNIEDTEIPAVQRFVHRITLARRALGTEVVIRKLATFVSHVVNYLTNRRAQSASLQAKVREAVRHCLFRVREIFQQAAEDCSRNIEGSFAEVKTQLCFGKKVALKTCSDTVLRWGSRPPSGLPYPTYKATCSRNGTFSSPACGAVDFNEELSRPLLTPLQMVWNEQFSIRIPQHLGRFKVDVLEKLEYFFSDLLQRVRQIEGDIRPVNHIRWQQLSAVRAKLENFAILLMNDISARQRSISRILTPSVQTGMMPAYLVCALEHGPRCFDRMKSQMEKYVHEEKDQLFSGACRKLTDQLDLLKQEIHSRLKQFLDEICNELSVQFEPVLKPLQIIDEIIPKLIGICKWMTTVCARSQVDFNLPKIEESDEEAEPTTILRKPVASETPPLRELEKFLGKVKMMKINQTDVNPTDPVEISADEVVLKYEEHSAPHEERVPFHLLSSCEFCVSMPFLILNHRWNGEGVERTDVVVLDEERRSSQFAQWMEALMVRWQWQLVFLRLELQQGIQRLQSLRVIYQGTEKVPNEEETLFNWPGSNADASTSTSSSSIYVDSFRQSRKRPWCELDRQEFPPWGQTVQLINTETQTRPPVLKKEKRDCMDSGLTLGWECRSEPPVLEKQDCRYPTKKDFDNV
ncbi:uncharacterized protein [Mobula birostris]|uniref:uncharacterized protein isoform X3 n=1 Tax=Mobula birostris TaxID=1983395 RepID=UPI003B27B97D